jgi:flagellar motor switch protein FliM
VSEILTPEEISALFDAFREPVAADQQVPRTRRTYLDRDEARRNRAKFEVESLAATLALNDAQIAALGGLYESFAVVVDAKLRRFLGEDAGAKFLALAEQSYRSYCFRTKKSVHAVILAQPMKGPFAIGFGFDLAHAVVDSLLGRIPGQATRTDLNDVEKRLVLQTVDRCIEAFNEVWEPIAKLGATVQKLETRMDLLQLALADDLASVATLELTIGEFVGELRICMPNQVVKPFLADLAARAPEHGAPSPRMSRRQISATLDVEMDVSGDGGVRLLSRLVQIRFPDGARSEGELVETPEGLVIRIPGERQNRAA